MFWSGLAVFQSGTEFSGAALKPAGVPARGPECREPRRECAAICREWLQGPRSAARICQIGPYIFRSAARDARSESDVGGSGEDVVGSDAEAQASPVGQLHLPLSTCPAQGLSAGALARLKESSDSLSAADGSRSGRPSQPDDL